MSDQQRDEPNDVVDGVVIRRPEWARPAPPSAAVPDSAGPDGAEPDSAGPDGAGPDGAGPDTVEIEHLPSRQHSPQSISTAGSSEPEPGSDTIVTTPTGETPRRWLHLPRSGAVAAAVAVFLLGGAAWVLAGNRDDDTPARGSAAGQADLPLVVLGDPSVPEGPSASSADSPSAGSSSPAAGSASDRASSATSRGSTVSRGQQRRDLATTGATRAKGSTTTRPGTSSPTSASSTSSSSSPSTGQESSSPSSPSDSPSHSPSESEPGDGDNGKGKGRGTGSPSPTETTSPSKTTSPTTGATPEPDCLLIFCR